MKYLIILLLCFIHYWSIAQEYNFQRFSIEEGLPRSGVYDIYEDTNGFLWIGTQEGGLSVFDGKEFHTYTTEDGLISNTIRCIYEDKEGVFWVGTDKGASSFDGTNFKNYTTDQGLPNFQIRAIQEDKEGNLFFGTLGGGLCKLKKQIADSSQCFDYITTENGLSNNKVRSILKDSKSTLWVGTDGGISKVNGNLVTTYTTKDGLPNNKILTIFEDKNHNLWFGTKKGVVELKGDSFITYTTKNGLIANRVRAISQDYIGNLWFGTREGASCFDGTKFKNITTKNGLSNKRIRVIKQDRSNNLWFGTFFGGINKYIGETFINYTNFKGRNGNYSDQVYSITGTQNKLVIGTFESTNCFNSTLNSLTPLKINALKQINSKVHSVHYDQFNLLWVGTENGLFVFKDSVLIQHIDLEANKLGTNVLSFFEDDYIMFIGTDKGIYKTTISTDTLSIQPILPFFIKQKISVNCIFKKNDGDFLVGTQNEGLLLIDEQGKFKKKLINKNLHNVNAIVKDNFDRHWCASEDFGLICLEKDHSYKIYNEKTGLNSNHAHLLIFDNHDDLWVGFENGVDKIQFSPQGTISEIYHFGKDEGFVGIETNKNAVYKDYLGKIWFGTIKGAICYNPHAERINTKPPITHILEVKFTGQDTINEYHKFQYHQEHFNPIPENLTLPYQFNNISFKIKGINLSIPHKVKYQWKLEGYDKEWSNSSKQEIINYTNLPYGNYTFLVKASNENDIWNSTPIAFNFKIITPFWKKNWFYFIVVFSSFGLFYLVFQWRVNRLQQTKKELETQVLLRTKELQKEKEIVEEKNEEIENKRQELEEKNTAITDSINYAKRIQQAVMAPKEQHKFSIQDNVFILYKPRDIVSGDFYWFTEKDNKAFVIAADCTGHGVPGAFMSMLGITFLNHIINEKNIHDAAEILNLLRTKIVDALTNSEEKRQSPDGMDLSLLVFDFDQNHVQYSGANNPLFYIKKDSIYKIKANKMPIGWSDYMEYSFTNHTIPFSKGDSFYIFSDGYVDQFGGEFGKKFMSKTFRQLLLNIHEEPLEKQKNILNNTIEEWQGNTFQVDDILVIGIKI